MIEKLLACLGIAIVIGGCLPFLPGDSFIWATGSFTDGAGKVYASCRIEALAPARKSLLSSEKEWFGGYYRIDSGMFAISFPMAPHQEEAIVEVSCRGAKSTYRSPIFSLAENREVDLGHVGLERATSVGFQEALCSRDVRQTELALSTGQDPNVIFTEGFGKGHTPLTLALAPYDCLSPASFELVALLVDNGADVNKRPDALPRAPPLFEAVSGSNLAVVEYLVRKGADVNARDMIGRTPLMGFGRDSSERPYQIADVLLKAGADPKITSSTGSTAESEAEMMGRKDIAELIRRAKQKQ